MAKSNWWLRNDITVFFRQTPQGAFEIENWPCHFYPLETFLLPSRYCRKLASRFTKKHKIIYLCRFCLHLSAIDTVKLSLSHFFEKIIPLQWILMVSAWIAMIRFPLRMLLLESGQYDGALVICVARLGKRGRGVFRGRGVNRKNTVIHSHFTAKWIHDRIFTIQIPVNSDRCKCM